MLLSDFAIHCQWKCHVVRIAKCCDKHGDDEKLQENNCKTITISQLSMQCQLFIGMLKSHCTSKQKNKSFSCNWAMEAYENNYCSHLCKFHKTLSNRMQLNENQSSKQTSSFKKKQIILNFSTIFYKWRFKLMFIFNLWLLLDKMGNSKP